jgi:phenylpyruvate tautomerase PptA (4-oxalocrotonate tautomerase family)
MTSVDESLPTVMVWVQVRIGRPGYVVAFAGLAAGCLMDLARQEALAGHIFEVVFALLLALPVMNVVGVLIEEMRRRDWAFAGLAGVVLAVVGYRIFAA